VASRAVLVAFAIVAAFAVCGRTIFTLFGITLPAFRIAGGLLVGLVGFHLLQGKVVTRLMGLILAVIGVQMVLLGLQGARLMP
jgi:small neutral amino acid transporter SnatA (MarC family)